MQLKPISKQLGLPLNGRETLEEYRPDCIEAHFDGSFTEESEETGAKAGFGVAVAVPDLSVVRRYSSPVVTNPRDPHYRGARHLSNNSAELEAAIMAMEILCQFPAGRVRLGYDSEFAKKVVIGKWHGKRHAHAAAVA